MKNIKTVLMMAVAMLTATSTLTSCFNDDDNETTNVNYKTLTKSERNAVMLTIDGTHKEQLYFYNAETNKTDSVAMNVTVTASDSTFVFDNFPVDVLANYVTSETAKDILKRAGQQRVEMHYTTPYLVYEQEYYSNIYGYYILTDGGVSITVPKQEGSEGEADQVTLEFVNYLIGTNTYGQSVYLYQTCTYYKQSIYGGILLKSVNVAGNSYTLNRPLTFNKLTIKE